MTSLTVEQQSILEAEGDSILCLSFAGTGKTYILEKYTAARPDTRFVYIVFNRKNKEEAESKFGSNVTVITAHSLAYRSIGYRFKRKIAGSLKTQNIVTMLPAAIQGRLSVDNQFFLASECIQTLSRFLMSVDAQITLSHTDLENKNISDAGFTAKDVIGISKALWEAMKNPSIDSVPMLHDGYLKLYQLKSPYLPGDVLLFDEAQDANPVMLDIVNRQNHMRKIYVGDDHQQMYGFRNAVNAMSGIDADEVFHLTKSFRFGDGVADIATQILGDFKGETRPLIGNGSQSKILTNDPLSPFTFISRSNAGLLHRALNSIDNCLVPSVIGNLSQYDHHRLTQVYNAFYGREVSDPLLKRLNSPGAISDFAEKTHDRELRQMVNLINARGRGLLSDLSNLQSKLSDSNNSDIILTTSHKAKGLEFPRVKLADDFVSLFDVNKKTLTSLDEINSEEVNMLYVAVTRAEQELSLNQDLSRYIQHRLPLMITNKKSEPNQSHTTPPTII